ncbi:MAG: FlgD immunoglobulin-like domain containing protein [Candidatus Eisenbacteria bacterium]
MMRWITVAMAILVPAAAFAVDYDFTCSDPVQTGPLGTLFKILCLLENNEATPVEFFIGKSEEFPPGVTWEWTASICVNGLCLAPFINEDTVTVAAGDVDTVEAWISTYLLEGSADVLLTVYPMSAPGEVASWHLAAITNGIDLLLVDDDGGVSHQTYFTDALPSGMDWGRWPRREEAVSGTFMNNIGRAIWFTGGDVPTLEPVDITLLTAFLDNGGKLLLSSQQTAYNLCDPGSADYSSAGCDFLADYLGVSYQVNNSGSTDISGDPRDPIGDGLSFSIAGGAGNQWTPDGIAASGSGNVAFTYDNTSYAAGVHTNAGARRTVYLAFGLEGISNLATRQAIIDNTLAFFDATVGVAGGDGRAPVRPALGPNRPNPFNPTTTFSLVLPEPARAKVEIFDGSGRSVATLLDGPVAAGETSLVWNGTNGSGAPVRSGVYFARMTAGDRVETRKLTLLR